MAARLDNRRIVESIKYKRSQLADDDSTMDVGLLATADRSIKGKAALTRSSRFGPSKSHTTWTAGSIDATLRRFVV